MNLRLQNLLIYLNCIFQAYPNEGLSSVVRNVFDFDAFNSELRETIIQTLHKHGIPVGADPNNISLAKE